MGTGKNRLNWIEDCIKLSFGSLLALLRKREDLDSDKIYSYLARTGVSWEHWVKFEYSRQLDQAIKRKGLIAAPEYKRHDIGLCEEDQYLEDPKDIKPVKPVGAIEIKCIANWCVDANCKKRIVRDIEKLDAIEEPPSERFVLVFMTFAIPQNGRIPWMERQLNRSIGKRDKAQFINEIEKYLRDKTKHEFEHLSDRQPDEALFHDESFAELSLTGMLVKFPRGSKDTI